MMIEDKDGSCSFYFCEYCVFLGHCVFEDKVKKLEKICPGFSGIKLPPGYKPNYVGDDYYE